MTISQAERTRADWADPAGREKRIRGMHRFRRERGIEGQGAYAMFNHTRAGQRGALALRAKRVPVSLAPV